MILRSVMATDRIKVLMGTNAPFDTVLRQSFP